MMADERRDELWQTYRNILQRRASRSPSVPAALVNPEMISELAKKLASAVVFDEPSGGGPRALIAFSRAKGWDEARSPMVPQE